MTASGDGGSRLGGPVVASGLVVAGVLVGFGLRRYPGKLVVVLVVGLAILSLFAVAAGGTVGGDATHPTAANVSSHGDHHEVEAVETSGGMMDVQLVANGTVVNGSPTEPPGECTSVREERAITVHAGNAFAEPGQVFSYQRTNRTLPACTRVEVTVVNHDSVRHQWMVHGLPTDAYPMGMFNVEVQGDSRVTATFVTPTSGRYAFHCSLPQHEQKGMHGALVIVGTDDTNDTDAAAAAQVGTQDGATGARERQGASPTAGSGPGFGAVTALTGLGVGSRLLRV
jgi:hypothetical protein